MANSSSRSSQWYLNDQVINDYLKLCMERYPDVYCYDTFFYTQFKTFGYKRIERWTRKVNIFSKRLLLVPINIKHENFSHWVLVCVNNVLKTISYYDSLKNSHDTIKCLTEISKYLLQEHKSKLGNDLSLTDWVFPATEHPIQKNGKDCGVFLCTFAEYLCRGAKFNFDQTHILSFRQLILYELTIKRLIDVDVPASEIVEFIKGIVGETSQ